MNIIYTLPPTHEFTSCEDLTWSIVNQCSRSIVCARDVRTEIFTAGAMHTWNFYFILIEVSNVADDPPTIAMFL